ncbi:hypothetical protein TNCV_4834381 [Trichonephila clavipes]|nr:hypothetical protein TNCV_4834381 [Trichonephila clavipes]
METKIVRSGRQLWSGQEKNLIKDRYEELQRESSVNGPEEVAAILVEYQRAVGGEGQYLFEHVSRGLSETEKHAKGSMRQKRLGTSGLEREKQANNILLLEGGMHLRFFYKSQTTKDRNKSP